MFAFALLKVLIFLSLSFTFYPLINNYNQDISTSILPYNPPYFPVFNSYIISKLLGHITCAFFFSVTLITATVLVLILWLNVFYASLCLCVSSHQHVGQNVSSYTSFSRKSYGNNNLLGIYCVLNCWSVSFLLEWTFDIQNL